VKQYYAVEASSGASEAYNHRIVPTGLTELMVFSGKLPSASYSRKNISHGSILSGQQKEFYDLSIPGAVSLFSIVFEPHGLMRFFDVSPAELCDRNVPLRLLINNASVELEAKLNEAVSFTDKVMKAEKILTHWLQKNKVSNDFERIKYCTKLIKKNRALVSIDLLASKTFLSRRQFERIFAEHIGITPKQFLRTIRFQNALFRKSIYPKETLTALAYECGYYDQAHMNRDFRELAGMSPKTYFSITESGSDYFV
jgi:AraC-like DNA-binding protein